MSVYEDLSPYEYLPEGRTVGAVNVGWLGEGVPYSTGSLPVGFLENLVSVVSMYRRNATRGFHECPFCGAHRVRIEEPVPLLLGHAEYHIPGVGGIVYAAPTLMVHYIGVHGYRPPDEFVEAVLTAAKV